MEHGVLLKDEDHLCGAGRQVEDVVTVLRDQVSTSTNWNIDYNAVISCVLEITPDECLIKCNFFKENVLYWIRLVYLLVTKKYV